MASVDDTVRFRGLGAFPEPGFSDLAREAFSGYAPSQLLTDVLQQEEEARAMLASPDPQALRIGAFQDERLVGWTHAVPDGANLRIVNSGVASEFRRRGIYSQLVRQTIDHAIARGYVSISSRQAADNNAVIVAKLKLGFFVSGFEYSEVYGPLVRLSYLTGELRRELHRQRSTPIRRLDGSGA